MPGNLITLSLSSLIALFSSGMMIPIVGKCVLGALTIGSSFGLYKWIQYKNRIRFLTRITITYVEGDQPDEVAPVSVVMPCVPHPEDPRLDTCCLICRERLDDVVDLAMCVVDDHVKAQILPKALLQCPTCKSICHTSCVFDMMAKTRRCCSIC